MTARAATGKALSSSSQRRRAGISVAPSAVSAQPVRPTPVDFSLLPPGKREWRLTMRLAAVCTSKQRASVLQEASALVTWALSSVDWRIVDEAIGWAQHADRKPVKPRAITPQVLRRAEAVGVYMNPFVPPSEAPAAPQTPLGEDE